MARMEVVEEVAEMTGISKRDTMATIDSVILYISNHLRMGEKVQVTGLGTFVPVNHPEKTFVNKDTGEKRVTAPKNGVKFNVSKTFIEELNN